MYCEVLKPVNIDIRESPGRVQFALLLVRSQPSSGRSYSTVSCMTSTLGNRPRRILRAGFPRSQIHALNRSNGNPRIGVTVSFVSFRLQPITEIVLKFQLAAACFSCIPPDLNELE